MPDSWTTRGQAGRKPTGRGRGDPGRGHPGAEARGVGRLDRAGLDRTGDQAGRREAVVADLDRGHADLAPAGRLREWQGRTYPVTGWPAIIDVDTMSGWSGCSVTRRGAGTWCGPRRTCCRASRPAPSAAGGCITGGTRVTARIPTGA